MSTSTRLQYSPLAAALFLAMAAAMPAAAQDAPAQDPNQQKTESAKGEAKTLDTVAVTGSRIKRSEIEGPAPVTIITNEQMRKDGFATVYDALQTITEALGPVQQDYAWGSTSVNAYPLNLRNLGPGRTLLLINGHRVADYPMPYEGKSNFSNYNNIPTGIVERIEVLSGAASAIYGSDAMGGVVNVVLKENADEHTLRIKLGEATRGGRKTADVVLAGGFSGDKWNLVYNLQHFDRGVLLAGDRPFMDGEDDKDPITRSPLEVHYGIGKAAPYPGLRLRQPGYVIPVPGIGNVTALVTPPAGACGQYGDLYYPYSYRGYDRNTGQETAGAGSMCAQRVFKNWALRTGSQNDSLYLHGNYDFSDSVRGWASLGVWHSNGSFNSFLDGFSSPNYWDPRATNLQTGATGGAPRNFLKFLSPEEMGGRESILTLSKELAWDFSAGVQGTFGERFDWEAMAGRAEYEVRENFPTYNQRDMLEFFMGPQQGTAANGMPIYTPDYNKLWNPVPYSETQGFLGRGNKKARSWLTQASFTVSGDLFEGWAGPIGFAGVLEAGKQGYKLTPDPKTLDPNDPDGWYTPFGNIEQGGGERNHYAAGVEFRVPLLKTLTANLAGRYDKYDAVASDAATTYQLGLEWRPTNTLLVRGTYGTSFRAPDMHFVYAQPSTGLADFTDWPGCWAAGINRGVDCRALAQQPGDRFYVNDATVARQGSTGLLYEEGDSWTAGFVWDAFEGYSLSIDYWKINIDNLIDDIGASQVIEDAGWCLYGKRPEDHANVPPLSKALCDLQVSRVIRNAAGTVTEIRTGPINRAATSVTGVDLKTSYRWNTASLGSFSVNLNYTNQLKHETKQFPGDPMVDDRKFQTRSKFNIGANWNLNKWNATLYMYQQGGGRNNNWGGCLPLADGFKPEPENGCKDPLTGQTTQRIFQRREPRRYFNGSVGYQFTDDLKLNFYVSNIFDKIYGDKWCADFAYCVDDPVGREVALELVAKIK